MDMYLLLRNNKQSGPHSLEDLKSMGLKAYDLVWLEGKSAAWRYPCEIEELSAFAPPVDEQPFDRFYKKPATSASVKPVTEPVAAPPPAPSTNIVPAEEAPALSAPIYAGEPSAVPGKRIIYVTMPSGRNPSPVRENPREPLREIPKEPARTAEPDPAHEAYASGPAYSAAHAIHRVEDYSAQLPSLKDQLEAVSPRRKKRTYNVRIVRPLAIGGTVLALLAAGIFIGLSLSRSSATVPQPAASKVVPGNSDPSIAHSVTQQLPQSSTTPALTAPAAGKPADSIATKGQHLETSVPVIPKSLHTTMLKEHPAIAKKTGVPSSVLKDSSTDMNSARATHRENVVETLPENKPVDKEAIRSLISSQVSVGANSYNVGTFGGINDLQLTVTNRSVYPLDLVVVEVQYIQANKKVYKTENLYFRNIGAGSALMQEAPKSSRGIKVQYRITTISGI
jgi:hypothetical protein